MKTNNLTKSQTNWKSLACLVNLFYETGLKALKVIIFSSLHWCHCLIESNRNRIALHCNRSESHHIASVAASDVSLMYRIVGYSHLFAHSLAHPCFLLIFIIHSILYCTFYLIAHLTHFILLFVPFFILTYIYIYIYSLVLCFIILLLVIFIFYFIIIIFFFLHFPLSGPVPTYISLLIIPCMIVYVTNNKEPWTLEPMHRHAYRICLSHEMHIPDK